MSIATKFYKILDTKTAIKQAIVDKGVDVPDDTIFENYPSKILEISGGSFDYGFIVNYENSLGISKYSIDSPFIHNNLEFTFTLSNVSGFEGFALPLYVNAEKAGDYKVSCDVIHTSSRTSTEQYINYWGLAVTDTSALNVNITDENARFPNKNIEGSCYTTFSVASGTGYTKKYLIFSLGGVGGLGDWTITNLKIEKI